MRFVWTWTILLCALISGCLEDPGPKSAYCADPVSLVPGDDLQDAVESCPEGTAFKLAKGIYRLQSLTPKNNQKFNGGQGVIFSGAIVLSNWRRDGEHWIVDGLPGPIHRSGYCRDKSDLCTYREDLFVNNVYFPRVATLSDLRRGNWYFENGTAYLKEDPGGKTIELGVVPAAFTGSATGVVIKNITVEKYASEAQHGAVDGSRSRKWELTDVVAQWNHGGGLEIGDGMTLKGGSYSHNGQIGIVGGGDDVTINSVKISRNNYAKFSAGWEAGGTKFSGANGLVVQNSCVHDNDGPGLWTDINNVDTLYESNIVFNNNGDGIKHEISYSATIRGNLVGNNGKNFDSWLWGSQILIQNSSNVEVVGNTVQVAADGGNAISMIYQDRGTGTLGPWVTTKNRVHQNKIVFLGPRGAGGTVADFDIEQFEQDQTNRFERNVYVVVDTNFPHWRHVNHLHRWPDLQSKGSETGSKRNVGTPSPISFSCKNLG